MSEIASGEGQTEGGKVEKEKVKKNPQTVVIFMRSYGYFLKKKDPNETLDIRGFLYKIKSDLDIDLKLKRNDKLPGEKDPHVIEHYTGRKEKRIVRGQSVWAPIMTSTTVEPRIGSTMSRQQTTFADLAIDTLEESGYLEPGQVRHSPNSEEEMKQDMHLIQDAVVLAIRDCPPLVGNEEQNTRYKNI